MTPFIPNARHDAYVRRGAAKCVFIEVLLSCYNKFSLVMLNVCTNLQMETEALNNKHNF